MGLSIAIRARDFKGDNWRQGRKNFQMRGFFEIAGLDKKRPTSQAMNQCSEDRRIWRWKKGGVATKIARMPKKRRRRKWKGKKKKKKKKKGAQVFELDFWRIKNRRWFELGDWGEREKESLFSTFFTFLGNPLAWNQERPSEVSPKGAWRQTDLFTFWIWKGPF